MIEPAPDRTLVRFAAFQLDLQSGELYKSGHRIRLQSQPLQVLSVLLERPGKVITREELRQKLWPADTFVDFEHGLNSAVARLREALSDSLEAPRFIETIPKRGYRFAAQVVRPPIPEPAVVPPPRKTERFFKWLPLAAVTAFLLVSFPFAIKAVRRFDPFPRIAGFTQITNDGKAKGAYATLATDGMRIYFDEVSGGTEFPSQVSASGGETAAVSIPKRGTIYDVSPDGDQMLFGAQEPGGPQLWIQPLPAGAPRRVAEILADDASWFRDGLHIVFTSSKGMFSVRSDGTEQRQIASVTGVAAWPRVSPDGRRIRFTHMDGTGRQSLWEVDVQGANPHPLFPNSPEGGNECCGRWTADGDYYVFQRQESGMSNLWVSPGRPGWPLFSREPHQLTHGPLEFFLPSPSLDGKHLFAIGQQKNSELVRFDPHSRSFVPYLGGISATEVEISGDGQWALYVAYPEGMLWRCRSDGSERLQLTAAPMQVELPHWSPDGKQIAFTALRPGQLPSVQLLSASGGDSRTLVSGAFGSAWSPDGTRIAFNRWPEGHVDILNLENLATSTVEGSQELRVAAWSPDGRYLLAKTSDHHRALLFDMGDRQWSEVARADMLTNLRWANRGDFFFLEATTREKAILIKMSAVTRSRVEVMDFQGIRRPLATLSAAWTGLAEDGSPIMQRDTGIQEIYALAWHGR